jgi:hypothetical protein
VIDPLLSLTIPPEITASAGMDIVCHALESYTARWYTTFDRDGIFSRTNRGFPPRCRLEQGRALAVGRKGAAWTSRSPGVCITSSCGYPT